MGKKRSLPPLVEVAEDVARKLGGVVHVIHAGEHEKAAAIAFDGVHLMLVRDHGHQVAFSLPHDHSWELKTAKQLAAAEPEMRRALEGCPRSLTMSDVMLALQPAFPRLVPSFPGVYVPEEAVLRSESETVLLFQTKKAVRILLWIGRESSERVLTSLDQIADLAKWLEPELVKHRAAREAEEAEGRRRAALPPPTVEEVIARLRTGKRISTGGGRYFETFFMEEGRVRVEIFDEGWSGVVDATDAHIAKAIGYHPECFRNALEED